MTEAGRVELGLDPEGPLVVGAPGVRRDEGVERVEERGALARAAPRDAQRVASLDEAAPRARRARAPRAVAPRDRPPDTVAAAGRGAQRLGADLVGDERRRRRVWLGRVARDDALLALARVADRAERERDARCAQRARARLEVAAAALGRGGGA